ncbi:hypothetical protein PAPYR_5131 [Paratrimastix pyriformis]|uniref:Peptidase C1A papain C-terminal domain-containing protein n=1 Tax=Paratrimastix pyriformis TaxID=342808 RepID=A0ABQ8UIL3_9EUKA|nr:hypothetical protein PAPYR_5131 [Paratrimastix pyriformis]
MASLGWCLVILLILGGCRADSVDELIERINRDPNSTWRAKRNFFANVKPPAKFDWREKAPLCVGRIRSQYSCGSCWAQAVATLASDRICLSTGGQLRPQLSAQYLLSCDTQSNGCAGGFGDTALQARSRPSMPPTP